MENYDVKDVHDAEFSMLCELNRICEKHNINYFLAYGTALGAVRHNGFIPWDTDLDVIVDIDNYKKLIEILPKEIDNRYEFKSIQVDSKYDSLQPRIVLKGDTGLVIHIDIYPMVGAPSYKISQNIFNKAAYFNQRLFFVKKVNANYNYKNNWKKRAIAKVLKAILLIFPEILFFKINDMLKMKYEYDKSKYIFNLYGNYGQKEFILKEWLKDAELVRFETKEFPVPQEYNEYLTHIYGDYMTPKKDNYV